MKSRISYTKEMREQAIRENKPLFTLELDRRHVTGDDREQVCWSRQGAATPAADERLTRPPS